MGQARRALAIASCIAISGNLYAADFSTADQLFAARAQGLAAVDAAKAEYRHQLGQVRNDQEKIYAIGQMSRLDIFVGGMLQGADVTQDVRNERLDECIGNVDQIAATKSQEYYYYYLSCIALRARQANMFERIKYGLMMASIQGDALNSTKNSQGQYQGGIEGGGLLRVISAVRANTKAKPLGLYNAQEGVEFARYAVDTAKTYVRPFGELSGRDYFENYYYLARAEINLGMDEGSRARVEQGKQTVLTALQKISDMKDFNELPPGREPETSFYEQELKNLSTTINTCLGESDWNSCFLEKLN
jgi:hypothetical protein